MVINKNIMRIGKLRFFLPTERISKGMLEGMQANSINAPALLSTDLIYVTAIHQQMLFAT